jgi:hypothetical protein
MIKDAQVIALIKEYRKYQIIKLAALKTGMDRKTAAKYLKSSTLPSESVQHRNWRTHKDKLSSIWEESLLFLENDPDIEARTLFEYFLEQFPDKVEPNQLRSFQRKVKNWRIQYGTDKEVYFDQITIPGRMAQVDWLDMNRVNIFIEKKHYKHKLIHFTLNHSNVESATICQSESIIAIKRGLRDFLYNTLGKVPEILQIDNSSAATHREKKDKTKRVFNEAFLEILQYYGIKPQKNNIRKPNENGVIESQNGHLRNKIEQALKIRGNKNFRSLSEYEKFLALIIEKANKRRSQKLHEDLEKMKPLPSSPLPNYEELYVSIRNRSLINIKGITYSVPSRLIGSKLKAKIYEDKIELCSGINLVYSFSRVLGNREVIINYRHIINSLLKKPGAFENYKYKEELYPTGNFKKAYEELISSKNYNPRAANLEYLRILKLASDNIEEEVDIAIELILSSNNKKIILSVESISDLILSKAILEIKEIPIIPDLTIYDQLFLNNKE